MMKLAMDLWMINIFRHFICDSFDAEISSPNCKLCVHCLAIIMAQVQLPDNNNNRSIAGPKTPKTIKRQPMEDRAKPVDYEVQQETYDGPKKPPMPLDVALNQVPPLWLMVSHLILVQRAKENDFAFFKDMQIEANCPEYNGYKTSLVRQAGLVPEPKTEVAFLPLIDCLPAHHDTIKTAIVKGLTLVKAAGQESLIFTVDQQLYKVTIDILFHQPSYSKYVLPVLGGMHMLMNFIHSIAVIMAGSGMK
ncbi:MAG: hypothetical protein GY702_11490, partial [Desulfobulbaceae bacterium]|nr:hypothetical protein [Desulfobulbaceae bacterium]